MACPLLHSQTQAQIPCRFENFATGCTRADCPFYHSRPRPDVNHINSALEPTKPAASAAHHHPTLQQHSSFNTSHRPLQTGMQQGQQPRLNTFNPPLQGKIDLRQTLSSRKARGVSATTTAAPTAVAAPTPASAPVAPKKKASILDRLGEKGAQVKQDEAQAKVKLLAAKRKKMQQQKLRENRQQQQQQQHQEDQASVPQASIASTTATRASTNQRTSAVSERSNSATSDNGGGPRVERVNGRLRVVDIRRKHNEDAIKNGSQLAKLRAKHATTATRTTSATPSTTTTRAQRSSSSATARQVKGRGHTLASATNISASKRGITSKAKAPTTTTTAATTTSTSPAPTTPPSSSSLPTTQAMPSSNTTLLKARKPPARTTIPVQAPLDSTTAKNVTTKSSSSVKVKSFQEIMAERKALKAKSSSGPSRDEDSVAVASVIRAVSKAARQQPTSRAPAKSKPGPQSLAKSSQSLAKSSQSLTKTSPKRPATMAAPTNTITSKKSKADPPIQLARVQQTSTKPAQSTQSTSSRKASQPSSARTSAPSAKAANKPPAAVPKSTTASVWVKNAPKVKPRPGTVPAATRPAATQPQQQARQPQKRQAQPQSRQTQQQPPTQLSTGSRVAPAAPSTSQTQPTQKVQTEQISNKTPNNPSASASAKRRTSSVDNSQQATLAPAKQSKPVAKTTKTAEDIMAEMRKEIAAENNETLMLDDDLEQLLQEEVAQGTIGDDGAIDFDEDDLLDDELKELLA
eukprot:TRINITY_DN8538_c0_g1_i1.p1 TRINITY_DN8538_c0_g1~~TRINITY_DN8538_c0_g1_i1.p1  ORF type:complete len:747 (+),score=205.00 TRINITY_DN8538_c0_g1_i1:458-2698(+)